MKNYAVVLLIAHSLFFSFPHTGFAAPVETESNDSRPITLGLWFGYSPSSVTFLSKMRDTRLLLAGLEVTHSNLSILNTPIELSAQLILYGQTDFPENGSSGPRDQRNGFGLMPGLSTNGMDAHNYTARYSLNFVAGYNGGLEGVELGKIIGSG